jgi:alkylhydroperoxidase family enzyme
METTCPRLAPLEPPYAPEVAATLAAMMPPGVPPLRLFRTLAHNPRVLEKIRASNLLDRGSIERREREIVILRATARAGAAYEWGVHVAFFAERVGLGREEVAATAHGAADDPAWGPRERLLVRLVDQLHETARIDDALWRELSAAFTPAQRVELVVLAGFYRTISCAVNAFGVEHEPGAW